MHKHLQLSLVLVSFTACASSTTTDHDPDYDNVAMMGSDPMPAPAPTPAPSPSPDPMAGSNTTTPTPTPTPTPEPAPPPFEITPDLTFNQGPLVTTPVATECDPFAIHGGDGEGSAVACAPGTAVELTRDVYVVKWDRTNHVSAAGKEFDGDADESNCGSNPALCISSTQHGYARTFKVKVTCDKDAQMNPTAKFETTLGDDRKFPKTETGHTHFGNGYACAKSTGLGGLAVSAACKTKGESAISPQQVVAGAAAGNVFQDLYVAYAATHCGRALFQNVPDFSSCNAPELSVEAAGTGFKFQAKNETYSGKKKVTCTADCGAATPTLDCREVEDGNL